MSDEKLVELAVKLQKLGVSHTGVVELLSKFSPEEIEKQLLYLPFRKAQRPEAFIIEAVRRNYSAPKEFYAQIQPHFPTGPHPLDQDPQPPTGHPDAEPQGHGAAHTPDGASHHHGLPAGGRALRLKLPKLRAKDRPAE